MSVTVRVPTTLRTLTGGASEVAVEGATVGEVLAALEAAAPRVRGAHPRRRRRPPALRQRVRRRRRRPVPRGARHPRPRRRDGVDHPRCRGRLTSPPSPLGRSAHRAQPSASGGVDPVRMHAPEVLVVDDDPDIRAMLGYTLGAEFNVRFATNGIDAIDELATNPPDAMILDVVLPGVDGYDVLEARRERGLAPHAQVIMLTARTDEQRPRPQLGPRRRRLPLQAHRPGADRRDAPGPPRRGCRRLTPRAGSRAHGSSGRCTGGRCTGRWITASAAGPPRRISTRRLRVLIEGA